MEIQQRLHRNKIWLSQIGNWPIWLIITYILGVIADLITTILGTPQLQYEDNFLVKYFHGGWGVLVGMGVLVVGVLIWGFLRYIVLFSTRQVSRFHWGAGFLWITFFCFHVLYSYVISVNNLLSYFYLQGIRGYDFPIQYIRMVESIPHFYTILQITVFILAAGLAWWILVRKLRVKVVLCGGKIETKNIQPKE